MLARYDKCAATLSLRDCQSAWAFHHVNYNALRMRSALALAVPSASFNSKTRFAKAFRSYRDQTHFCL